jgi:hypothetical protein
MKEEDGKQEGVTKISLIPDAFYKSLLNEPYIYIYIYISQHPDNNGFLPKSGIYSLATESARPL